MSFNYDNTKNRICFIKEGYAVESQSRNEDNGELRESNHPRRGPWYCLAPLSQIPRRVKTPDSLTHITARKTPSVRKRTDKSRFTKLDSLLPRLLEHRHILVDIGCIVTG